MKDEIGKKVAGKAASLYGGPVGKKIASSAYDKLLSNKNTHDKSEDRLNNALNKKNQSPNPSSRPPLPGISGQKPQNNNQKNTEEETNKQEETTSKKITKSILGKKENTQNLTYAAQITQKAKKALKLLKFLGPLIPWIMCFIGVIVVISLVMSQIMVIRDKINDAAIIVTTGVEKYINFMTGNGWNTEEDLFFITLEDKYKDSMTLPTEEGEVLALDIPLVAATVNYSKVTNAGVYEDIDGEDIGEEDDNSALSAFSDFFEGYLQTYQTRNFYYVANDKLGDYRSLFPGNRRLLGHMIGYKITWKDVPLTDIGEIASRWGELVTSLASGLGSDYEQFFNTDLDLSNLVTSVSGIDTVFGAIKTFREMMAYDAMGENHDSYLSYHLKTFLYEFEELVFNSTAFMESDVASGFNDDLNWFQSLVSVPVPYITYYETLDKDKEYNFGHYLREVYIPGTFFSSSEVTEAKVNTIVEEIYTQRKYYEYLVGDIDSASGCADIGGENCTYDLSSTQGSNGTRINDEIYASVSNIKVNLVSWYNGKGKMMDENIPFEKYILGVVYAEIDGFNNEAQKAQAVAARSFSLVRPFEMGNSQYCNFKKNGDGWTLTLRGSTADQVYCDPELGCSADSRNFNSADIYPGSSSKAHIYKGPIAADAPVRTNVGSTAGQVLMTEDGNILLATFVSTAQRQWNELGKSRKYTDFLPEYYTGKTNGHTISIGEGNCSSTNNPEMCPSTGPGSGEWANWRQSDPAWNSIELGTSNIGRIGCAATSVAIQLARSGVETTFSPLNPGTFVENYKAAGGFVKGNIYFGNVHKVAPNFKYKYRKYLSGSNETKIAAVEAAVADGCYTVIEVKKGNNTGQHWVAVVDAKNGKITMADPASAETDTIGKYGTGISELICYKVEG